ncbi:LOB domain-containing protein 20-like [Glycine soja]|uniref:LOB domain-containing protein 20 n=1 Tax=Glycine soja TaxID=3848 RepID=A0A445LQZ5_GLYSO|nr:LOB domain-containing protein 20-like [Glycine soja]RZC25327.1 LOB domain-containing protein 20 [Glycine soja]
MAESQGGSGGDDGASGSRRRGSTSRRAMAAQTQDEAMVESSPTTPCGACKFLRRRCVEGCIFAPHFGTDQGAAKFAAVHKVFGASNVSKLLSNIPVNRRNEASTTISYEAQARLSDPVYGCVSTILALQQQVATLQAELAMLQTQLMNSRFAYASAFQTTQLQQPNMNTGALQPAYSNNSCASTNLLNLSTFNNNPSFVLEMDTAPSSSLEPLQLTRLSQCKEEDEEENKTQKAFNHR